MNTIEIKEITKELKKIGFTIKTKSLSFGIYGTLKHIDSGRENNGNCYSPEALEFWQPAFEVLKQYAGKEALIRNTHVYGLQDLINEGK